MRARCGSAVSAWRRTTALALLLVAPALQAANEVEQQIDQAVQRHLASQLDAEAKRQGWQGMRFSHSDNVLNSTAKLSTCTAPLRVENIDASPAPLARQRLKVSCSDPAGWSVLVNSQATVFVPALFASTVIERDQPIGAAQLATQELNVGKAPRGFYQRRDDVIGQTAKRRIRANQPLSPGLLIGPVVIKRGQQVRVVASQDGIQAETQGEALRDGRPGEVIKVRNLSSEKVIEAKVLEAGVVSSIFK
ncbi:flagellar basal body P-ring formation chaperone FlgA [Zestomonas insulae]|uniref:flagellar basal body P-ring formation chaperone FlgA n=1 Tax=Zestomonas insulae TaxID=2809017 RepID=UPI001EF48877|nr:flagellar basal body P-ring formation chaperone FlgA [Pseudomonas insulae]